jgi:hypothetical protein
MAILSGGREWNIGTPYRTTFGKYASVATATAISTTVTAGPRTLAAVRAAVRIAALPYFPKPRRSLLLTSLVLCVERGYFRRGEKEMLSQRVAAGFALTNAPIEDLESAARTLVLAHRGVPLTRRCTVQSTILFHAIDRT